MKIPYVSYNAVVNAVRAAQGASGVPAGRFWRVYDAHRTWLWSDESAAISQLERTLGLAREYGSTVYPKLARHPLVKAQLARAIRRLAADVEAEKVELRRRDGMKRLGGDAGLGKSIRMPDGQRVTLSNWQHQPMYSTLKR